MLNYRGPGSYTHLIIWTFGKKMTSKDVFQVSHFSIHRLKCLKMTPISVLHCFSPPPLFSIARCFKTNSNNKSMFSIWPVIPINQPCPLPVLCCYIFWHKCFIFASVSCCTSQGLREFNFHHFSWSFVEKKICFSATGPVWAQAFVLSDCCLKGKHLNFWKPPN